MVSECREALRRKHGNFGSLGKVTPVLRAVGCAGAEGTWGCVSNEGQGMSNK